MPKGKKGHSAITKNNLPKYLGPPKYYPEMDQEQSQVGLSTGLAWTQVGGEALYVEASLIGGKGRVDYYRPAWGCHAGIRQGRLKLYPGQSQIN